MRSYRASQPEHTQELRRRRVAVTGSHPRAAAWAFLLLHGEPCRLLPIPPDEGPGFVEYALADPEEGLLPSAPVRVELNP